MVHVSCSRFAYVYNTTNSPEPIHHASRHYGEKGNNERRRERVTVLPLHLFTSDTVGRTTPSGNKYLKLSGF
jgi:hypothetical protein